MKEGTNEKKKRSKNLPQGTPRASATSQPANVAKSEIMTRGKGEGEKPGDEEEEEKGEMELKRRKEEELRKR
jgi:hypothetical protein